MITRSDLEFFQHFGASASRQLTNNGQNSKQKLEDCLVFPQDNEDVVDDRGAQHSHTDSTYPQWSSSSSSSSKSSFRPSSSSASGGVFGSTARNDRTSALKVAFQVFIFHLSLSWDVPGRAVAPRLVRWTPERAIRVRGLTANIVLCSWAKHFTLSLPLSTQVYKWIPAN